MIRNLLLAIAAGVVLGAIKFYYFSERATPSTTIVTAVPMIGERESADRNSLTVMKSRPVSQPRKPPPSHSNSREIVLEFPNGKKVSISLADIKPPNPTYSRYGPFLDGHYSRLKFLADAGDANAAMELHDVLNDCEYYVEPGVTLSEAVSKNRNESIGRGEAYVRHREEQLSRYYVVCEGVDANMLAEKDQWLEKASDGRNPLAMQKLFLQKDELQDSGAQLILEKMWEEGHTSSLLTHAVTSLRKKDPVLSYAYYLAYFLVAQATWNATQYPEQFQRNANIIGSDLASKGSMLSSADFQRAEELAFEIVKSNKNCCKGFYDIAYGSGNEG